MTSSKVERVIVLVESMLCKPVWKETFLLRWAHDRIEGRLNSLREVEVSDLSEEYVSDNRESVFVEIYQKDLGIITLSKVISSLGDRAFAKNIYHSYTAAKNIAEVNQRLQRYIAYIEIKVLSEKIIQDSPGDKVTLDSGAIVIDNIKGAWFRDTYYMFDGSRRMFVRS